MDENPEAVLDVDGAAAPPRANGELVFAAPWESRIFGVTMALYADGRFEWEEFRRRLIAAIARSEARLSPGEAFQYYVCWAEALGELLHDLGLCDVDSIGARENALAARPPGHDHSH